MKVYLAIVYCCWALNFYEHTCKVIVRIRNTETWDTKRVEKCFLNRSWSHHHSILNSNQHSKRMEQTFLFLLHLLPFHSFVGGFFFLVKRYDAAIIIMLQCDDNYRLNGSFVLLFNDNYHYNNSINFWILNFILCIVPCFTHTTIASFDVINVFRHSKHVALL